MTRQAVCFIPRDMATHPSAKLPALLKTLNQHFGPQHWWPAETPFEVAVGAFLTQNTSWNNVEYAIYNLRQAKVISPQSLAEISLERLQDLIRPAGFFRQKALRLQEFSRYLLESWDGDLLTFCAGPLETVRDRLLAQKGVGPETADSILLYAADRPTFVIDAYTRRIFQRVGLLSGNESYEDLRRLFMQHLPHDASVYSDCHAQIVSLAKTCCLKKAPLCSDCPFRNDCSFAKKLY